MESTFTPNSTATRRRKITKFALAGVAVLGVGAALTSAAWSDDVFFNGTAKTAAFELQGWDPVNGGYKDADNDTLSITLPGNALTGVGPGISARYAVTVHNGGEIPINLQAPVTTSRLGTLFEGLNPAGVTYSGYSGDGVLTAGEDETVDVIVTGPLSWAGIDYQNTSGSLTIRITGTS